MEVAIMSRFIPAVIVALNFAAVTALAVAPWIWGR
jgi:hypothetical protein